MAATEEQWLRSQISRWERKRQRAERILQHLHGLLDEMYEDEPDENEFDSVEANGKTREPSRVKQEVGSDVRTETSKDTSKETDKAKTNQETRQQTTDERGEPTLDTKKSKRRDKSVANKKDVDVQAKTKPPVKDRVYSLLDEHGVNTIPRLDVLLQESGPKVSRQGIANALEQLKNEGHVVREDATEPGVKYQWRAVVQGGLFEAKEER